MSLESEHEYDGKRTMKGPELEPMSRWHLPLRSDAEFDDGPLTNPSSSVSAAEEMPWSSVCRYVLLGRTHALVTRDDVDR